MHFCELVLLWQRFGDAGRRRLRTPEIQTLGIKDADLPVHTRTIFPNVGYTGPSCRPNLEWVALESVTSVVCPLDVEMGRQYALPPPGFLCL